MHSRVTVLKVKKVKKKLKKGLNFNYSYMAFEKTSHGEMLPFSVKKELHVLNFLVYKVISF